VRAQGLSSDAPARPPLGGRIFYLVGGTLPLDYRDWVRQDLTGPGWIHRQALRILTLSVPFALMFLLLPGQLSVRLTASIFMMSAALGVGYATAGIFRDRRLAQNGLDAPAPSQD
jgi:Family of unknown function (DUF5313)